MDDDFYGIRPYDASLYQHKSWFEDHVETRLDPGLVPYHTSSFWRFLMERYLDAGTPRLDEERLKALSDELMASPPPLMMDWVDWVAQVTHKRWGPFRNVYAEFVSDFATWPEAKYEDILLKPWLDLAFDGCQQVKLSPGRSGESAVAKFEPKKNGDFGGLYPVAAR